jgi:hypothetical protein
MFSEKRMLDTLMMPPRDQPDLEIEADRVIAAYGLHGPSSKTGRAIAEQTRTAIKKDIDIQWHTELEMKKRRIMYAQWVTQGAIENMAQHYEDWDINSGERTSRRWRGDSVDETTSHDAQEGEVESHLDRPGDLANLVSPKRKWSKVDSDGGLVQEVVKTSPHNDRRRGGRAINIDDFSSLFGRSGTGDEDEFDSRTASTPAPDPPISPARSHWNPWAGTAQLQRDLAVRPPIPITYPDGTEWPAVGSLTGCTSRAAPPPSGYASRPVGRTTFRSEPGSPWITPQRPSRTRNSIDEGEPLQVQDMLDRPASMTLASTLRITQRPIVDEPVAGEGWMTVRRKSRKGSSSGI